MKRPTIADVAARAGVSKSTVSHTLSGKRPISAPTRQRVFAAIEELGYRPHPVAQRLATGQSRTIAFVFPLLSPNLAGLEMKFITGSASVINQADYAFLLMTHLDQKLDNLQRFARSGLVDGFILMQVHMDDPRVEILQQEQAPFVLVGRCADNTGFNYVDADVEQAMWQCIEHLAGLGHRTVAYLHQERSDFGFLVRALDSFAAACRHYHLIPLTYPCDLTPESGQVVLNQALEQHPETSAVIIWNDIAALGLVQAARARNLRIPQDLSFITFDYSTIANLVPFKPTVVDIRGERIAAQAAQMMIDLLEGDAVSRGQRLIDPEFIPGDSTGPAPDQTQGGAPA